MIMKTKYVRVPFEVELAKKITEKSVDGKIVTRDGRSVRIVCWDRKCVDYPIIALIDNVEKGEGFGFFTTDGATTHHNHTLDLMLEIPEYMTFKDGDVLFFRGNFNWVFIYKKGDTKNDFYFAVDYYDGDIYFDDLLGCCRNGKELRLATETEKQELIEALKASKEPKAKDYLKRFFGIEVKQEYEFKPFDKVLTRDNSGIWICSLFSHISNSQKKYKYITVAGSFEQCIPYNEQTAHLLGTTENYE